MPNWTVKDLLDYVQDLIGEPVGGYYNISSRLRQMNHAQREMVQDTRALTYTATLTVTAGTQTYQLPDDFLTYAKEQPYFVTSTNQAVKLDVVDVDWMDNLDPGWRTTTPVTYSGSPRYLIMTGPQEVQMYPTPGEIGTLKVPYVLDPDDLDDFTDQVFNGVTNMNRYSVGLAYKVASMYLMPRVPQLGQQYLSMYQKELRQMRHDTRVNPQHPTTLRPKGYGRRSYT